MPAIDLPDGDSITAAEFIDAVANSAPLALQDPHWKNVVKMAFFDNRLDCLQLAKTQAAQIQRGQVGNGAMAYPQAQPYPMAYPQPQQFPTTYQPPQSFPSTYAPPAYQPVTIAPQIHLSPTISPQITNSPTQSTRSEHSSIHSGGDGWGDAWGYFWGVASMLFLILAALAA